MIKSKKVLSKLCELSAVIAVDNLDFIESKLNELKSSRIKSYLIYETILQAYLFCGFPIVIESLRIFKNIYPKFLKAPEEYNPVKFRNAGIINCKLIYKNNYKKLIANMDRLSSDLKNWMLIEGYGKIMNRQGLKLIEREFINVSILCTKFYKAQLHSHLKGCLNLGADKSDIEFILREIKSISGEMNYKKTMKLLNSFKIHNT
jgi:4-carboxymuconolactone decarboxylase